MRELFKNSDIKRSIIKAFVYKIEIGGEPKYRADIYFAKGKRFYGKVDRRADIYFAKEKKVSCQVDRRGPYRRHRREGVVVVSSPINAMEELE